MDNKTPNIRRKTFNSKVERFQPIVAIGKLLFFDYNKINLGLFQMLSVQKTFKRKKFMFLKAESPQINDSLMEN
jgi:hypothetical protein